MYTYRLIHTAWSHLRARCQSLGPYLNIGIAVQDGGCDPTAWMASPLLRAGKQAAAAVHRRQSKHSL
jgi:hypothetical protein